MSHKKSTSDRSTPTKSLNTTTIELTIEQLVVNTLVTYKSIGTTTLNKVDFESNKRGSNSDVNLDPYTTLNGL